MAAIESRGLETRIHHQPKEIFQMNLASMVYIWLGLALLLTFALCRAASGPTPKPSVPDESRTALSSDNQPRSNPTIR